MPTTESVIAAKRGIILDVGCGASKQPGAVGMDAQELPGVDFVHSWNEFPWPFEDESVLTIVASHVIEHVNPADGHFLRWMDECHRVLKPGGQLAAVLPYGGSRGYWQDPTHSNGCNEDTWRYFDPEDPSGFYRFYRPKPWKLEHCTFHHNGNMEIVMRKRAIDE